jgi:hypothetical protein
MGCFSRRFLLLNEEDRGDQGLTRRVCRVFEGNYFGVGVSVLICVVCGGEENAEEPEVAEVSQRQSQSRADTGKPGAKVSA